MGQLAQRVVLIHKLGQLRGAEEFFHRSLHRFDVDQHLRGNLFRIMGGHPLANHSLQSGKADAILVLQKLSDRTDAAVTQMVDIVFVADAILKMDIIVDRSDDIFFRNMLRNQLVYAPADSVRKRFRIRGILLQDRHQRRIVNQLRNAQFPGVAIHVMGQIHHHIGENLDLFFLGLNIYIRNCAVLDGIRQLGRHLRARSRQNLTRGGVHHVFRQLVAADPVAQHQLLVEFISADFRQIISSGVEEHGVDQALRAFHAQGLAGTDLLIQLQKTFLIVLSGIFGEAGLNLGLVAEQLPDLVVCANAQGAQKNRDRHLSGAIHADVKHIVGIRLVFQPCSAVGDHGAGEQPLADLIMSDSVINAGGTHQLTDDDTFCAIDDKSTCLRH